MNWRGELASLLSAARTRLELERSFGFHDIPFRPEEVSKLKRKHSAELAAGRRTLKTRRLTRLRKTLEARCCCGLGETRTHLVFGDGDPDADLMFVGEAPGYHEDIQGVPFVGPAGQLLTRIIEAIGLSRDKVYIANICKCRPPENRTPLPEEAAACFPHLRKQIEIVQPKIIVVLGNLAARTMLQTAEGITKLRGRFQEWNGIQVMPTFHPSYLLRNPGAKLKVWNDMRKVWQLMRDRGLAIGDLKRGRGGKAPSRSS